MTVVDVADATETAQVVAAIADLPGPVYLRLKRGEIPVIFPEDHRLSLDRAQVLVDGRNETGLARGTTGGAVTAGGGVIRGGAQTQGGALTRGGGVTLGGAETAGRGATRGGAQTEGGGETAGGAVTEGGAVTRGGGGTRGGAETAGRGGIGVWPGSTGDAGGRLGRRWRCPDPMSLCWSAA